MRNVLTVMRKEFARFFGDKRLVLGTLLLPGLLIFVLYTIMGTAFSDTGSEVRTVAVVNPSAAFSAYADALADAAGGSVGVSFTEAEGDIEELKAEVGNSFDALAVFDEDFDERLEPGAPVLSRPNVAVYYDSADTASLAAYNLTVQLLQGWQESVSGIFNVNFAAGGDLSTAEEARASYYAMLLPFLILTLLYSACMGLAPESIAGEKERGTIATLLVTPVKRGELVVGKVLSLSALSALSAISSFIGTFLSLPRLAGGSIGEALSTYSFGQYAALLAVMLSAVLLIVSLISIVSAYARTVKEASAYSVPLMIVVMLVGLSSMIFGAADVPAAAFVIPVYNCVQVLAEIFSMNFSAAHLFIALGANLVWISLLVWVLARMFRSEKVIFNC